jgi:hypothetical protein
MSDDHWLIEGPKCKKENSVASAYRVLDPFVHCIVGKHATSAGGALLIVRR